MHDVQKSPPEEPIVTTGLLPAPRQRGMRTGFTTGSCATAAAMAAAQMLCSGVPVESTIITLPAGQRVRFLLRSAQLLADGARCTVIKDAGDDPDVTHGAEIGATVEWGDKPGIELCGGVGVGTVTRPGLGLDVGGPAINPVPRCMILEHVARAAGPLVQERGLRVTIFIPKGNELAKRTLNNRLGITGGLSILGTTGIVQPFSTAAWRASVAQSLDVAAANGLTEILLSTGGRSEHFGQQLLSLPDMALIEMGEFTGFALRHAVDRGISRAHLCGMIGKYAKIAQGHLMTHVAGNQVDVSFLAAIAGASGAPASLVSAICKANTARHVQELIVEAGLPQFFQILCDRVLFQCSAHVHGALVLDVILFDFDGTVLARSQHTPGDQTNG
ncbi:MAG: cobalt-precorrin-5B (C(1))-methyltransferase [Chloroflexi bacterium]|nr:cobalt-precorrin-5B (C(1))-methyltransferase [Chloroflexota bacterium]